MAIELHFTKTDHSWPLSGGDILVTSKASLLTLVVSVDVPAQKDNEGFDLSPIKVEL